MEVIKERFNTDVLSLAKGFCQLQKVPQLEQDMTQLPLNNLTKLDEGPILEFEKTIPRAAGGGRDSGKSYQGRDPEAESQGEGQGEILKQKARAKARASRSRRIQVKGRKR